MIGAVHFGDCRDSLRAMAAAGVKVQMCVTSPPYFGLRDYGTGTWEGGDPACEHGISRWEGEKQSQGAQSGHASKTDKLARTECRCGAHKVDRQLGLEETPDQYIAAMVEVFRAVREVLADDGTLWVNIGDSYANPGHYKGNPGSGKNSHAQAEKESGFKHSKSWPGAKNKDLIGIPWRLAFALQADGWYLRQDIIWHKPNPMPESVTDRCTKAHEYLFLLSKSPRYYFDHEAIKEPVAASTVERLSQNVAAQRGSDRVPGKTNGPMKAVRSAANSFRRDGSKREQAIPGQAVGTHRPNRAESEYDLDTRNKRSVWSIATRPYKGAHFAVFPPDLIEPCILAGSRPGDVVLDCFMGSGTTAAVAIQHGRQYIGCELNPEYKPLQDERIAAAHAAKAAPQLRPVRAKTRKPEPVSTRQATLFDEVAHG
jgi:DNA modification methylase